MSGSRSFSFSLRQFAVAIGVLFLLGLGLGALFWSASARTSKMGCFERHMRDAIRLNGKRKSVYEALSGGRSRWISLGMMGFEESAIPTARWFQWRSRDYQKAGIPVMCDDFVPMSQVPPLADGLVQGHPLDTPVDVYHSRGVGSLMWNLIKANARWNFEGVAEIALGEIQALQVEPHYHCMRRHFLESIARAARLAPRYVESSKKSDLSSPARISHDFIAVQIWSLPFARFIDGRAAPLQARGIPIVCADVPHITIPQGPGTQKEAQP